MQRSYAEFPWTKWGWICLHYQLYTIGSEEKQKADDDFLGWRVVSVTSLFSFLPVKGDKVETDLSILENDVELKASLVFLSLKTHYLTNTFGK